MNAKKCSNEGLNKLDYDEYKKYFYDFCYKNNVKDLVKVINKELSKWNKFVKHDKSLTGFVCYISSDGYYGNVKLKFGDGCLFDIFANNNRITYSSTYKNEVSMLPFQVIKLLRYVEAVVSYYELKPHDILNFKYKSPEYELDYDLTHLTLDTTAAPDTEYNIHDMEYKVMDDATMLNGAIQHCDDIVQSESTNCDCKLEHKQLKLWLEELVQLRKGME